METKQKRLEAMKSCYEDLLKQALRRCAGGHWGLFGHNDAAISRTNSRLAERLNDPAVAELLELGAQIDVLRRQIGFYDKFKLHERLLHLRSSFGPNTPGEPKLAQQWVAELDL